MGMVDIAKIEVCCPPWLTSVPTEIGGIENCMVV
jgi:hypothetical protein